MWPAWRPEAPGREVANTHSTAHWGLGRHGIGGAQALLEQGTSLAGQLDDPVTRAFAAWATGHAGLFAGALPPAIAHCEDGLAAQLAAVRDRQHAHLLIGLTMAAGLAGDEERTVACALQKPPAPSVSDEAPTRVGSS